MEHKDTKAQRLGKFLPFYLFTLILSLVACDNIAEDERLIYVESATPVPVPEDSTKTADEIYDAPIDSVVPMRVLIEDHTGQHCPNCPEATKIIESFVEGFGSLIVPVAIHSQQQGIMEPEGLGNTLGNTYYNHWGLSYKPAGLVNRMDGGDGVVLDKTVWAFAVQYAVSSTTPIDVRIKAVLETPETPGNPAAPETPATTKANIDVKVICLRDGESAAGKLQVWITEDSIVAEQDSMGIRIPDYVHNHVLRAAVNGDFGEPVSVSGKADTREFHYTATLKPAWKPENLAIVAFVYNDSGVLQVVKRKLAGSAI